MYRLYLIVKKIIRINLLSVVKHLGNLEHFYALPPSKYPVLRFLAIWYVFTLKCFVDFLRESIIELESISEVYFDLCQNLVITYRFGQYFYLFLKELND